MKHLKNLIHRIINRVNVNLREPALDVGPYVRDLIEPDQFVKFYAFYGLTLHHPLYFRFHNSSLAGSYFLGKCTVEHSVLYKSDIRGDELKLKGDVFKTDGFEIPLFIDETIRIRDSFLIKTLVHNNSHDPENPEEFPILNTVAMHYANIHGSPMEGAFLGPFSTVDLTTVRNCAIGAFAYVQCGEAIHRRIEPGQVLIRAPEAFSFSYRFHPDDLKEYVDLEPGKIPSGIFMDFVDSKKIGFESAFVEVAPRPSIPVPHGASLSRYAVVRGNTSISENVLVAQRAYLENAWLGKGSNAQENCYIVDSRLEGNNITAHGGKIIHSTLGEKVFVGFNSFLRGRPEGPLSIGAGSIVMPHTIIDLEEPLEIPRESLVWGFIRNRKDLARHCLPLETIAQTEGELEHGAMILQGSGRMFVNAFRHRIEHILEANGAYFDGKDKRGHAQKAQQISFNIIQPYPAGTLRGLYPTIDISLPLAAMGIQKPSTRR
jgi:carbonic anhydrase/acetyltransferase-like protein (isoleucine patch superfamily)